MFFPIKDDDRALSKPAVVTHCLFWSNLVVFLYQLAHPEFTYAFSATPAEITSGVDLTGPVMIDVDGRTLEIPHAPGPSPLLLTLFSSMFMHGGFMHIASNMLYLWIFGDNVEHRFGSKRFLMFYLVAGLAGSFAHILFDTDSIIPTLGASGAISGILGAYIVLFPRNKVNCICMVFIVSIPAFIVIGLWAASQFMAGLGSIAVTSQAGGVAYLAHIGGFLAGVAMAMFAKRQIREEPDNILLRNYQQDATAKRLW